MWLLLHIHSLADSFIHSFIDLTCLSLCQVLSANRADVCLGEGTRSAAETVQRNLLVNVRALWLQKGAALLLKQMGESRHRVQPVQMKIVLCIAGRMDTCLRGRGPVLTQGWVAWGGAPPLTCALHQAITPWCVPSHLEVHLIDLSWWVEPRVQLSLPVHAHPKHEPRSSSFMNSLYN